MLSLIVLLPVLLIVALRVFFMDRGPIIYTQERLGFKGRPFTIYKFRSMVVNAEAGLPQLSSDDDARITKLGKVMRKWRLDELPQLWNIIKGDMSFVGPRPERKYFIYKITKASPEYAQLLEVRPGLSSWGMVQFGYAHDVDEMITRSKFDMEYLEKISFPFDLKVMVHTIKIILQGKGK